MKKQVGKLTLSRETVRLLDQAALAPVAGGATETGCGTTNCVTRQTPCPPRNSATCQSETTQEN